MEFAVQTHYDQKTASTLAKALRKTVRKKRSRRSHFFGTLMAVLSFLLAFVSEEGLGFPSSGRQWLNLGVALMLLAVLLWEDQINGYFVRKRMLPGTQDVTATFEKEQFVSSTQVGNSAFFYDRVQELVDTGKYIVFVFSKNHAQAYDKNGITGGTPEEFAAFLEEITGKKVIKI